MMENKFVASEMLERTASSVASILSYFNHEISIKGDAGFYCFVEGYDKAFYRVRVAPIYKECRFISCGGKSHLLAFYRHLQNRKDYKGYKTGFFIDRDYEISPCYPKDIFVTDRYSIENYYSDPECFENILDEHCWIKKDKTPEFYSYVVNYYREQQKSFHEHTLELNAWYAALKAACGTGEYGDLPKADELLEKNVRYEMGNISHTYTVDALNQQYGISQHPVSEDEMEVWKRYMAEKPGERLRGKFETCFLLSFLRALPRLNPPKKTKTVNVDKNTFLSVFCGCALSPHGLAEYVICRVSGN